MYSRDGKDDVGDDAFNAVKKRLADSDRHSKDRCFDAPPDTVAAAAHMRKLTFKIRSNAAVDERKPAVELRNLLHERIERSILDFTDSLYMRYDMYV